MCGFTTNRWRSRSSVPFLSLTIHYLDPEFKPVEMLLGCVEIGWDSEHEVDLVSKVQKSSFRL